MPDREGSSSSDDNEKQLQSQVERRGSRTSVRSRAESLHDLPDPDEGKSPEERQKIVSWKHLRYMRLTKDK